MGIAKAPGEQESPGSECPDLPEATAVSVAGTGSEGPIVARDPASPEGWLSWQED